MSMQARSVEFSSAGERIAADLYLPDGGAAPYPLVIMAGGWCYVKELIQPQYAEFFVDAGMAVLIFDYRYMGASGGEPRQHIDPWDQIEDYRNAISYAETLEEIDAERLGIWGISYSGGHVLIVGSLDDRVKCVVSNIPVVDGLYSMKVAHGSLGFRRLMAAIKEDRTARLQGGEWGYIPMSPEDPATEVSSWPFPEVKDVFLKLKAASAPAHEHRNTIASVDRLLSYTVFPYAPNILNTPTMMVVAEGDDITMWDREIDVYNAISTARKKLVVISDTSHMTLYSDMSRLEIAATEAAGWLGEHLA
jgi:fermentation-respiration switch protein FrsA (DUF1100 family)